MRGLYATLRAFLETYVDMQRSTGRTSKVVDAALPGDWIIAGSSEEMKRIERTLRRWDKKGEVRISAAASIDELLGRAAARGPLKPRGRILFTHDAIEGFYRVALQDVEAAMDAFEKSLTHGRAPTPPPGDAPLPYATARRTQEWQA
jgi:hypothetical protein